MPSAQNTYAAYVLAIESIKDRVADAKKLMESLGPLGVVDEIALIPAIYWEDEESVIQFLTRFPEHTFSENYLCECLIGQLATTLSHISVWRRLLESNHEGALVFEDDMYISDSARFKELVSQCQQDPDVEWVRIHLHKKFRNQVLQLHDGGLLVDDPMPFGFAAYYVSRAGAKKLLGYCHDIAKPIDWLPPLLKQHGLLNSKTVTEVVVEHQDFEGDEAVLQERHEIERQWYKLQKSSSAIWTSPPVTENAELYMFISRLNKVRQVWKDGITVLTRLNNVRQVRKDGITVLKGVFDKSAIVQARQLVLDNRNLFKNTRPTTSAGHLAGFHRYPALEPLHTMLTSNPAIQDFLRLLIKGIDVDVRSIGLSDITINRSQHWHNDLLRGEYKAHLNEALTWGVGSGGVYKMLLYLQDSSSLRVIKGSQIKPISLDNDSFSEPDEETDVASIPVHAGDVVIMDIRCSHRGAEESAYASGQWDDNPRILISTVLGGSDCKLTRAMEMGNFYRLQDWMDHHP